jgi:hypothetical protein
MLKNVSIITNRDVLGPGSKHDLGEVSLLRGLEPHRRLVRLNLAEEVPLAQLSSLLLLPTLKKNRKRLSFLFFMARNPGLHKKFFQV